MEKRGLQKIIILIISIFLFINFVNAQSLESLGTFKLGEDILLTQLCGTCTFNNISSVTSTDNASELITNVEMIKDGTKYTFLLGKNNMTSIGFYNVNGIGDKDGVLTPWSYRFEITKTGKDLTIEESLTYFILAFGVFLLFILSFYFMLMTPYSNKIDDGGAVIKITKLKYVKLSLILLTWVLFTWFLNILIGLADNFVTLTMYYGFFGFIFETMNNLAIPIGILIIVMFFFEIIRDANIQERISKFGKS